MGEEDLAAPPGAGGGLFDGVEVKELAAVVAGDGLHAFEKDVTGAFEAVEFADDGLLRPGGELADDLMPGHALGQDQEAGRGGPGSADYGVHLPMPVLAPVLGARRALRDRPAPCVGVGHARSGLLAPLSCRSIRQLRPGHAEQPGVDRVVDRPLARHPRQVAARAQPHDGGVRRETLQQDQVAEQGGDARGQPRAGPLVQGRPVRGVLRLARRVGAERHELAGQVHDRPPGVLPADRRAVPAQQLGQPREVGRAAPREQRPRERLEPDALIPIKVFPANTFFAMIFLLHGPSGFLVL